MGSTWTPSDHLRGSAWVRIQSLAVPIALHFFHLNQLEGSAEQTGDHAGHAVLFLPMQVFFGLCAA